MDQNQALADPTAIDEAARTLEGFVMRVRDFDSRLERELNRLAITFQDEAYERFRGSFETTRKLTAQFVDESVAVLPKLRKRAELIRAAQHLNPNA